MAQTVEVSELAGEESAHRRVRLNATLVDYFSMHEAEDLGAALLDAAVAARGGQVTPKVAEVLHRIRCHAGRTCAEARCESRPLELDAAPATSTPESVAADARQAREVGELASAALGEVARGRS